MESAMPYGRRPPHRRLRDHCGVSWQWDPTLYAGSASYYAGGRVAYPRALADLLAVELGLDGSGRLLDVGCGPGSLTLLLAPLVAEATGIDADPDMIAEAEGRAVRAGVRNVRWQVLRAEELPAGLGQFRLVTFAQSFHWMDRSRVAAAVHGMVEVGGACVHVHATTHEGVDTSQPLPHPQPPRAAMADLVRRYLGPERRAGRGVLPAGTPGGEDGIYRAAGFTCPRRFEVPGVVVERTADQVVAAVLSLSGSAPHLFGPRLAAFEADLRGLLHETSPTGLFSQQMREIAVDLWTP
jgi:SAM-dependent methyltransferase